MGNCRSCSEHVFHALTGDHAMTEATIAAPLPKRWNYWVLGLVFLASIVFQFMTLGVVCRCWQSAWEISQANAAVAFDGIVLVRIVLSLVLRERNEKWAVWAVLSGLSPFWISWIFDLTRVLLGPLYGI
jgi:hypothetical protein